MSCAIYGCRNGLHAKGYCSTHYTRLRLYADPLGGKMPRLKSRTTEERFWEKVKRRGPDECWPWVGGTNSSGYGSFNGGPRYRSTLAARFSYDLHHPNDPLGERLALHSCDNPPCVNPAHLRPGTHAENTEDKMSRGRFNDHKSRNTHCPSGHVYAGANLWVSKRGVRQCKTCNRIAAEAKRRAKGMPVRSKKTHCIRGHAIQGENASPSGDRIRCRICVTAANERSKERKKALAQGAE